MALTVHYALSESGRRASLLSGGDGRRDQSLTVPADDPAYRDLLALAVIHDDGSAVLMLHSHVSTDHRAELHAPLTSPAGVLVAIRAAAAAQEELASARREKVRAATMEVLTSRRTTTCPERAIPPDGVYADGVSWERLIPAWPPYERDADVTASGDAVSWLAALASQNAERERAAMESACAARDARLTREASARAHAESIRAEESALRAAHNLPTDCLLLRVESGALTEVPAGCWESHSRGKNWCASIRMDPAKPGGTDRDFWTKAKGDWFYLLPSDLPPGTPLEFGADYYSGSGRRSAKRWYGYVLTVIPADGNRPSYLALAESASAKTACKQGAAYAASLIAPPQS